MRDGIVRDRCSILWIALVCAQALFVPAHRVAGSDSPHVPTYSAHQAPSGGIVNYRERASSANAFVNSIGVQTHFNYPDTPYSDWPVVMNKLVQLGVHHIRDALPFTPALGGRFRQLAAQGIQCTCGFTYDKELTASAIVKAARSISDVEALEAPNECDAGNNCGGGGEMGIANVVSVLPILAKAGRILQIPVIGPSFTRGESYGATGSISRWATFNNLHVYFGGRNPGTEGWGAGDSRGHRYGSFDWWFDQANLNAPGLPVEITETGYESFVHPDRPGAVPYDVEAKYLLRTLLLAWNHGARRTFIYELFDEFPGSGYGLLRHDLTEKPAYAALKSLLSILKDSPHPLKPGTLGFSIGDGNPALCHTLLEKADGSYDLILWNERSGYDEADPWAATTVRPLHIRFRVEGSFGVAQAITYNEDASTRIRKFVTDPSTLLISVNDCLTILHIIPRRRT